MKKLFTLIRYIKKLGIGILPFLLYHNNKDRSAPIEIKIRNLRFPFKLRPNSSDIDTFVHIFYNEMYAIEKTVNPAVIIDCGANIGMASLYFKMKYPEARIFAIEPENSNYNLLVNNTSHYKEIQCYKNAVWNKKTKVEIFDPGSGHWGYTTNESRNANDLETITIDELMEKESLNKIDVLKIDIEGAEKELFESNYKNWVSKTDIILIELHDGIKEGCSRNFFTAIEGCSFDISNNFGDYVCIKKN